MNDGVATDRPWEVIVVGTGVGGATIGSALAKHGLNVLFLEKGGRISRTDAAGDDSNNPDARMARGWWPNCISHQQSNGKYRRFFAAVGCATGGSSVHYAAALERMAESDFAGLPAATPPVAPWPVSFEEFKPYYAAAETLYRAEEVSPEVACGRMSQWDRAFMDHMRANGLHPDPLHVAIRYDAQCTECIGTICARNCKSDAVEACLVKALMLPNCKLIEHCEVQSLDTDAGRTHTVRAICEGRELKLSAGIVVLAAGAFHSPQVLLRSCNDVWPDGLANRSGQVGRNLMFHTSDIFAVWAPRRLDRRGRQKKSISVRDFYFHDGERLGYVQSMGLDAGRGVISAFLKDQLRRAGVHNEFLLSLLVKVPSHIGAALFGEAGLFAGMTEDDPNPDNRIRLDPGEPDGASFTYTITEDLRRRAQDLYREFSRSVRPWRLIRLSAQLEMNYGHPCGTCRFGDDPAHSVLDRHCRAHGIDNLYVVDSSFMPRSGAVNPSLTIAANALRVADHILARTGKQASDAQPRS